MPSRCDLNSRTGLPALASSKRLATRLIISPLWYSFGPNTLKNLRPAHCGGSLRAAAHAVGERKVEQMLAAAVEVHRPEPAQCRRRPVVVEAVRAVAIGRRRRSVDEGRAGRRAPVEQPQRQPEVGVEHEVAVGRGGVGDRAQVDDGVELAAVEPGEQLAGRHHVGQLALGEIAPFAVAAEHVVDDDVAAAGLVQAGHDVRPDEPGPAGDQQHPTPPRRMFRPSLCPRAPAVQLAPMRRGKQADRLEAALRAPGQPWTGGLTAFGSRRTRSIKK